LSRRHRNHPNRHLSCCQAHQVLKHLQWHHLRVVRLQDQVLLLIGRRVKYEGMTEVTAVEVIQRVVQITNTYLITAPKQFRHQIKAENRKSSGGERKKAIKVCRAFKRNRAMSSHQTIQR